MFRYRTYLCCFMVGLVVAWALTPLVIGRATRWGVLDRPVNRKIHKRDIPLLGGLGIFFGMWVPLLALCFYSNAVTAQVVERGNKLLLIFLGGLVMLVVGIIDDARGLNARWKFATQFPTAIALVAAGVRFDLVSFPYIQQLNLSILGPIISVFWLVGITNALNLIDGIDGLAGGVAVMIASTLGCLAVGDGNALLAVVMFSMAGASLGFLRYNFSPAKIFLGDSGSLFLGMTLAVSATLCSVKMRVGASLLVPVVLLGYPITDTMLAMVRRYLRGKPMFSGDASHIHHRLLYKGLDHRKACCLIYCVCLGFCLWTIAIKLRQWNGMLLGLLVFALVAVVGIHYLGFLNYFKTSRAVRSYFRAAHCFSGMIKAKIDNTRTLDEVVVLLRQASKEFDQPSMEINLPAGPWGRGMEVNFMERNHRKRSGNGETIPLLSDRYQFDDTGLQVAASYEFSQETDEFLTEKRALFEEICEAANHRLAEMVKAAQSRLSVAQAGAAGPLEARSWGKVPRETEKVTG